MVVFVVSPPPVSAVVGLAARRTRTLPRSAPTRECCSTWPASVLRGEQAAARAARPAAETFGRSGHPAQHRPAPRSPPRQHDPALAVAATSAQALRPPDEGDTTSRRETSRCAAWPPLPPPTSASWSLRRPAPLPCASSNSPKPPRPRPAEADRRTALLSAVSHDLRTPLTSAMAAVESLPNPDITSTDDDTPNCGHRQRIPRAAPPPGRQPAAHEPPASRRLGSTPQPLALDEIIPRALTISGRTAAHPVDVPGRWGATARRRALS